MDKYLGKPLDIVATYKNEQELRDNTDKHQPMDIVKCEELNTHLLRLAVGDYPWLVVGNPCNICGILNEELLDVGITTWMRYDNGAVRNETTPISICKCCINTIGALSENNSSPKG